MAWAPPSSGSGMALVIFDTRIGDWNNPSGMVGRYLTRKAREVAAEAEAMCPVRTGALAASIAPRAANRAGPNSGEAVVTAGGPGAWYALCVLQGTHGPNIYAKHAKAMWVPESRGSERRVWMHEVNGQEANDFLGRALASVMGGSSFLGGRAQRPIFRFG